MTGVHEPHARPHSHQLLSSSALYQVTVLLGCSLIKYLKLLPCARAKEYGQPLLHCRNDIFSSNYALQALGTWCNLRYVLLFVGFGSVTLVLVAVRNTSQVHPAAGDGTAAGRDTGPSPADRVRTVHEPE